MLEKLKKLLQDQKRWQKICTVIGTVTVSLLVIAVIIGVLNGLVANGEWEIGWSSYRYDETGYEIGGASVPSKTVRNIEIDWIDGEVEIILCDDAFISITEFYEGELAEKDYMRHRLSEDGSSLSVKYRKSAAFVGIGGGADKKLTVRVPKSFLGQIQTLTVNARSANVTVDGVTVQSLSVTTKSGDIDIKHPEQVGFTLSLSCESDRFLSNLNGVGDGYVYGEGASRIALTTKKGTVTLYTKEAS